MTTTDDYGTPITESPDYRKGWQLAQDIHEDREGHPDGATLAFADTETRFEMGFVAGWQFADQDPGYDPLPEVKSTLIRVSRSSSPVQ